MPLNKANNKSNRATRRINLTSRLIWNNNNLRINSSNSRQPTQSNSNNKNKLTRKFSRKIIKLIYKTLAIKAIEINRPDYP